MGQDRLAPGVEAKVEHIKEILRALAARVVFDSGGVDSTLLLKLAHVGSVGLASNLGVFLSGNFLFAVRQL